MKNLALLATLIFFASVIHTEATPYKKRAFHIGFLLTIPLLHAATHSVHKKGNIDEIKQFQETIAGTIGFSVQQAFKSWEKQCRTWKRDVEKRNGKRLKSVNCGDYQREIIDTDSEAQRFVSQGSLVIKTKR